MSGKQISDRVFDALFKQAVIDNLNDELDSLPPYDELAELYAYSPAHEKRMKRLFAREEHKQRLYTACSWSRRAAAVVVIAVSILFSSLMLVTEVRAAVTGTIIEWYTRFVRFTSNAPAAEKKNFEPGYIPAGYREALRDELDTLTTILYMNDGGMIIIFQSSLADDSISVDAEGHDHAVVWVDGVEYHTFAAVGEGEENALIWEASGQRYHVSSELSLGELFKIGLSVGR